MKTYLKYTHCATFGVINSGSSNSVANERYAIGPALENVQLWDLKKGTLESTLTESDNKAIVTCLALYEEKLAAGYSDGKIRIWDINTRQSLITFNGHKSAVTALVYGYDVLASGSKDTDIIVWDMIAESGLYRLKGHKDQITGLVFLNRNGLDHLISTSKDSLMKVWDLETQHCIETIIAHRSEVWALDIHPTQNLLYTAASDQEIRIWNMDLEILRTKLEPISNASVNEAGVIKAGIELRGIIERSSKERAITLKVHPSGKYFGVQGSDKTVELFKNLSNDEIKKKMARKRRRMREKALKKNSGIQEGGDNQTEISSTTEDVLTVADEINFLSNVRCSAKIRSFYFIPGTNQKTSGQFGLLCSLSSNAIEIHQAGLDSEDEPTKLIKTIELQGHRSDIRALALSSDDEVLLSGSNSGIKLWNLHSQQCIRSINSGYVLCAVFAPGNKYVIIGTKTGELELYDLGSSSLVESIKAHEGPIWSIEVHPDNCGLTSGSADKEVKFWDFNLVEDLEYSATLKRFTLTHTKTLKMSDDVLCIKHSPDGKLIAIALLDCSIKIFYSDSMKFFLSLYGHKLPVLTMDISSDSTTIATGSADKSIKLWGLDFGDCHRSLRGHTDSVMNIKFVWGTHYFFSVSKDKTIKYWDADKFENIMTLHGHQSEVWALAVAKFGRFVVTGSNDRSIRVWNKTDEQLFIEEEREKELEEMYENLELDQADRTDMPIGSGVEDANGNFPKIEEEEVGAATKKTIDSLKAGEKILEAIEIWESEMDAQLQFEIIQKHTPEALAPQKSPFILAIDPNMTPEKYVLYVVQRIRNTELEEALLTLPFSKVEHLFTNILTWLKNGWNSQLSLKVLYFLLAVHHKQIVTTASMKTTLLSIQEQVKMSTKEANNLIGYNFAALQHLQREIKERKMVDFGEQDRMIEAPAVSKRSEKRKRVVIVGK